MTKKTIIKLLALLFVFIFSFQNLSILVVAEEKTLIGEYFIDAVNATRWADTSVIYYNRTTTEQNEWGYNVVVDADGKVTELINSGDIKGKNLVIPTGGMIVSANGNRVEWLKENVSVGDFIIYDNISSRILVSKDGNVSPYFEKSHKITGFNSIRYSDTFIVYDKPGKTGTNGYGYEVLIDANGTIIQAGGNDNTVPDSGFVVSAVSAVDKQFLKMYGIVGATAQISNDKKTITFVYDQYSMQKSIEQKVDNVKAKLAQAIASYKVVPYSDIGLLLQAITSDVDYKNMSLIDRNKLLDQISFIDFSIYEKTPAEIRGIWHAPVEKNITEVEEVVTNISEAGLNQLLLCVSNGYDAIMPLPDEFPFKQKSSLKGFDLLQAYVDECKKADIELILCVGIFRNSAGKDTTKLDWLTKSNGADTEDESDYFFSPANNDFSQYIKNYIIYILDNYAIDGLQLDYIRYPAALNGIDYGYDEATKQGFAKKMECDIAVVDEIAAQTSSHAMWDDWVNYKADLVTKLVSSISLITNTIRPDISLSAAVASDTKLSIYCQNTEQWIEELLLDALYPMTYGEGVLQGRLDAFKAITDKSYIYLVMGSGSYLNLSDTEIYNQSDVARYFSDGVCYFEYTSYFKHGSAEFLSKNLFYNKAISPTLHAIDAARAQIDFLIKRINDVIVPADALSTENAASVCDILYNLKLLLDVGSIDNATDAINAIIISSDAKAVINADLAKIRKFVVLSKDAHKAVYNSLKNPNSQNPSNSIPTTEPPTKKPTKAADFPWGLVVFGIGFVLMGVITIVIVLRYKKLSS